MEQPEALGLGDEGSSLLLIKVVADQVVSTKDVRMFSMVAVLSKINTFVLRLLT